MTKPPSFDILDVRLFNAIAEYGSLSGAAAALPLALSAASSRLRLLEDRLGLPLFRRHSTGMALTPAGEIFASHAARIVRTAQDAQAAMDGLVGRRRETVIVWANMTAVNTLLPGQLGAFMAKHSYLSVTLTERPSDDVVQAVLRGDCDLGVIDGDYQQEGLVVLPMGRYRMAVLAAPAHPLAAAGACSFRALTRFPLVGYADESGLQRFLEKMAGLSSVEMRFRAHAPNFAAAARLIADGIGIAVMPEAACRTYVESLGLTLLTLTDDWADRHQKICVRPWETLPAHSRALAMALSGVA